MSTKRFEKLMMRGFVEFGGRFENGWAGGWVAGRWRLKVGQSVGRRRTRSKIKNKIELGLPRQGGKNVYGRLNGCVVRDDNGVVEMCMHIIRFNLFQR